MIPQNQQQVLVFNQNTFNNNNNNQGQLQQPKFTIHTTNIDQTNSTNNNNNNEQHESTVDNTIPQLDGCYSMETSEYNLEKSKQNVFIPQLDGTVDDQPVQNG
ncbi:unnamed protein product, partial [Adineta steineri]